MENELCAVDNLRWRMKGFFNGTFFIGSYFRSQWVYSFFLEYHFPGLSQKIHITDQVHILLIFQSADVTILQVFAIQVKQHILSFL